VLDSDSLAAHVHGKIVFKIEFVFFSGSPYLFQVRFLQIFQNPVIEMQPIESSAKGLVKKLEGAHLSGPGQVKSGPGLPDAVQIKAVGV
jgi:hypothetical protein